MAANAGGESVALGGLDSEDGIEHACFSDDPHRFGLPSYAAAAAWAANGLTSGITPVKLFRDRSTVALARTTAKWDVYASKGQGDTLTRRGGDGAPADEAALGTDALQAAMDEDGDTLGPPSASASKGRGAGSCCDGDALIQHGGNGATAAALGLPIVATLGLATRGAAMVAAPPHDGATALPTTAPGAMEVATVQAPPNDGTTTALHANIAEADASVEAWARELLPTIPRPAIEYNLPVIDVQRYWRCSLSIFLKRDRR
jgi:hypothetical protein